MILIFVLRIFIQEDKAVPSKYILVSLKYRESKQQSVKLVYVSRE